MTFPAGVIPPAPQQQFAPVAPQAPAPAPAEQRWGTDALPPLPGGAPAQPAPAASPAAPQPQTQVAPQQPATFAQQPTPPQAPAPSAPQGVAPNTVIQAGPGVPPELVGRTIGQAFQIYGALANEYVSRSRPVAPAPAPAAAVAQPAVPAGGMADEDREFWASPAAKLRNMIRDEMNNSPATQATLQTQAREVAGRVAATMPDFQALLPEISNIIASASPQQLLDPAVWQGAADIARGRMMRSGTYQVPAQQQAPQGPSNQPWSAAGGMPAVPAQSQQAAVLPQFAFFSEGPTPPSSTAQGSRQLTAAESDAATKFGMSPADYLAWKGGVRG